MKNSINRFPTLLVNICFGIFILMALSCEKDCDGFDKETCPDNIEEFIILRFDMDSLNGGFTKDAVDTLLITYPRTCNPTNYENLNMAQIYDRKNSIFCAMNEYYCCTECATGFKLVNEVTGTTHVIDNIRYTRRISNDYCCGDYYYIESFYYNGQKYAGGTDVIIQND